MEFLLRDPDLPQKDSSVMADRRDPLTLGNRLLGRVSACTGGRATIAAMVQNGDTDLTSLWSIGRLISIDVGENRVVALVYAMRTANGFWSDQADNSLIIDTELMGEVCRGPDGIERFSSGITQYPYLGAVAHRIRSSDLECIYHAQESGACVIGRLSQDLSIDATIHIPSMLSKHFAVVGSTGVGKSTAVSLLLHKAIESDPKLRVLILDPHNEFAAAFPDHAVVIDTDTLDLPFWLMRLEEFTEVIYRGRTPVPEEVDILRDLIPEAKRAFKGSESGLMRRSERAGFTADTPVPYRLADLLALIDERIGKLDGRDEKPYLRALKMRILSAVNDPRYHFMFSSNTISDTIVETVAHIFRVPGNGRPISTFQLAGIPSEIVNAVASVLCRMAFELAMWSKGAVHMLVVCEEAHRYVPADPNLGFFPTRQAIARIAKEGRKYGISLGIITQRPGELDQTILSQCSTVFAMRLANERDQDIIRSALPDSSISTTSFISSIGNGEAIAFGEAIAVPMRMKFERVSKRYLPKASGLAVHAGNDQPDAIDLSEVISRMRASTEPDISAFQQSYLAQEHTFEAPAHSGTPHFPLAEEPSLPVEPVLEPYRPGMLPGAGEDFSPAPEQKSGFRPQSAYAGLRKPESGGLFATAPSPAVPRPAAPRKDTGGMSLRDSILKRPLTTRNEE